MTPIRKTIEQEYQQGTSSTPPQQPGNLEGRKEEYTETPSMKHEQDRKRRREEAPKEDKEDPVIEELGNIIKRMIATTRELDILVKENPNTQRDKKEVQKPTRSGYRPRKKMGRKSEGNNKK